MVIFIIILGNLDFRQIYLKFGRSRSIDLKYGLIDPNVLFEECWIENKLPENLSDSQIERIEYNYQDGQNLEREKGVEAVGPDESSKDIRIKRQDNEKVVV